jgi:hypothetical protein
MQIGRRGKPRRNALRQAAKGRLEPNAVGSFGVGSFGVGAATQCINAQALWKMTNAANIETQNATL